MRPFAFAMLACSALCAAAGARAQDAGCDEEPPREESFETFPANGARGVALDAPLRVRFPSGQLDGFDWQQAVEVTSSPGTVLESPVPGAVSRIGDTLVFAPTQAWLVATTYRALVRGPAFDYVTMFESGTRVDAMPPFFEAASVEVRVVATSSCVGVPDARRIEVQFAPAYDVDGAPGDIEYVLYQTRGTGLAAPTLRDRARNIPASEITMAFVAPQDAVAETFCVRALAIDGVGRIAQTDEACLDPRVGDHFQALCSAAPSERGDRSALGVVLIALVAASVRVSRRRR